MARLLNGFIGGGMYAVVPLYLSEIANDRVRGLLGSSFTFSCNFGILLAFTFGNFFDFYTVPILVIALSAIFGVALLFFPESPSFLMKQNKISVCRKEYVSLFFEILLICYCPWTWITGNRTLDSILSKYAKKHPRL